MTTAEQLQESSAHVERACVLLLTPAPDALDNCSEILETAAQRLQALRPALHTACGDPEALAEAWRLQRDVRRAGVLLANASAYHAHWNELLGAKTAGYRCGGHAEKTPRPDRLCFRG
jgi:hypothetical protein